MLKPAACGYACRSLSLSPSPWPACPSFPREPIREEDEYNFCKVEGFELIPLSQMQQRYDEVPKDRPVYVMCHHGMRSMQVTRYLRTRGFRAVSNVEGGIEAWSTKIDPKVPRY